MQFIRSRDTDRCHELGVVEPMSRFAKTAGQVGLGINRVEARWTVHTDPTAVPGLQGKQRPRGGIPELLQENWSPTTRFVAGLGGVALSKLGGRFPAPLARPLRGAGAVRCSPPAP